MRYFFIMLLMCCDGFSQGKNLVERSFDGVSKDKNAMNAKAEILNQATDKISTQLIQEIIGEGKYSRNRSVIENKIIKNSGRYIPYSKPGDLKEEGEGYKMNVQLRLNLDDLQALLLENGLFYETDGTPSVISSIRWNDQVNGKTYLWWRDGEDPNFAFISKQNRFFEISAKNSLARNNFYFFQPLRNKMFELLPEKFRSTDRLKLEDWQALSPRINAQIFLDGEINIKKSIERSDAYLLEFKLAALQVQNGRSVADITRHFETDPGSFENSVDKKLKEVLDTLNNELSNQIFEAWQRGSIGAELYKLTIRGNLSLPTQELVKEAIKSKLREIKNIRERLITADGLVYDVDTATSPKDMAIKAPELDLGSNQKLVLQSANDREIVYKVVEVRK